MPMPIPMIMKTRQLDTEPSFKHEEEDVTLRVVAKWVIDALITYQCRKQYHASLSPSVLVASADAATADPRIQ